MLYSETLKKFDYFKTMSEISKKNAMRVILSKFY